VNSCIIENIDLAEVLSSVDKEFDLKTNGFSMFPLFDDGSVITIRHEEPDKIKIGDVILFRAGDHLVAHRVIKRVKYKNGNNIIKKGDNNSLSSSVNFNDLLGKVLYVKKLRMKANPNENQHQLEKRIKVDTIFARVLGLTLSFNDQVVKNMNSVIIKMKEKYCYRNRALNLSLGGILYILRFYRTVILNIGRFLFNMLSRKCIS